MELVIRATVIYFFLWAVARGTGKRELSQMTAFELILLVVMGDLIQQGTTQEDTSLTGAMIVIATMAFWILLFSYLAFRFKRARDVIDGVPVIVIRDGQLIDQALRLERITEEEVLDAARAQGIADLDDVWCAVLEPDGKFSFLRRSGEGSPRNPGEEKAAS